MSWSSALDPRVRSSALLAQRGYQVLVLEKQHFPRFSIGESLLAYTTQLLLEAGMLDAVVAGGFQYKNGATFVCDEPVRGVQLRRQDRPPAARSRFRWSARGVRSSPGARGQALRRDGSLRRRDHRGRSQRASADGHRANRGRRYRGPSTALRARCQRLWSHAARASSISKSRRSFRSARRASVTSRTASTPGAFNRQKIRDRHQSHTPRRLVVVDPVLRTDVLARHRGDRASTSRGISGTDEERLLGDDRRRAEAARAAARTRTRSARSARSSATPPASRRCTDQASRCSATQPSSSTRCSRRASRSRCTRRSSRRQSSIASSAARAVNWQREFAEPLCTASRRSAHS